MNSNSKTTEIDASEISRRRLIQLGSAGIAAALAGCSGSGEDGGSSQSTVYITDTNTPEEVNMNRFALNTGYHWIVREFQAVQTNSMEEPDWEIYDGEETTYDPETWTWHYKVKEDEFYWANGDPITAEDFYYQTMNSLLQQPEEQRWAESVELLNDWEWEATMKNPQNPMVRGQPTDRIAYNKGYEKEWYEKLEDVSSQSERDEVSAEIVETRISLQDFIDEGMSSSVWKPVEYDETSVTFEKNEKHPYAEELNYDELVVHTADGSALDEMIINDRVDIGEGRFPEKLRAPSPDHLQTIAESRALSSRNLYFRYLNDHMANRWVRRAMLTVLDLNFLVDFFQGEGGFIKQNQSGVDRNMESQLFDSEFIDSLYDYPIEGDEELAAEFMREGDYEREDGTWIEQDTGESIEFHFAPPAGSMYEPLADAINDRWQEFGLEPNYNPRDFGYLTPNLQDGTGDIDVTLFSTGWSRGDPRDYFSPINPFFLHLYTVGTDDYQAWLDEGRTHSANNGRPIIVEIPEEPGDIFLEGSTKEINLIEKWLEFMQLQDREEALEILRDFVIYFNYDLPRPDLFPQINALWGDTNDYSFPDGHDYYNAVPNEAKHLVHRYGVMEAN